MLNKVILHGRIGKKPELKQTQSGSGMSYIGIAVDRNFSKDGKRETDWFDCVAFGKTAEIICKYFDKGSEIIVEGHLQKRKYKAQDGSERVAVDIVIENFDFAGKKGDTASASAGDGYEQYDEELPF